MQITEVENGNSKGQGGPVLVGALCGSTVLAVRCCGAVDVRFRGRQMLGAVAVQQLELFLQHAEGVRACERRRPRSKATFAHGFRLAVLPW